MRFINDIYQENLKNCVVVLGNFDGLHKGHLSLLDKAKEIALNEYVQMNKILPILLMANKISGAT